MRFDVVTLYPELFITFREVGLLGKAVQRGDLVIDVHDLRAWAENRHCQVDDQPYGGGPGMVIRAEPAIRAVRDIAERAEGNPVVVVLTPRGKLFDQTMAQRFAASGWVVLLCGRYEGFDERVPQILEAEEVSLGDFVLGGGEVAAMAIVEATARLIPGVVGDPESVELDSFQGGLLDYPCYTRPRVVEGVPVPQVLIGGDHEAVKRWRLEEAVKVTVKRRPDLVRKNWASYPGEVKMLVWRFAPSLARELDDEGGGK